MGLVAQIGKFPDGDAESRQGNVDVEKHPAMIGSLTRRVAATFSPQAFAKKRKIRIEAGKEKHRSVTRAPKLLLGAPISEMSFC